MNSAAHWTLVLCSLFLGLYRVLIKYVVMRICSLLFKILTELRIFIGFISVRRLLRASIRILVLLLTVKLIIVVYRRLLRTIGVSHVHVRSLTVCILIVRIELTVVRHKSADRICACGN